MSPSPTAAPPMVGKQMISAPDKARLTTYGRPITLSGKHPLADLNDRFWTESPASWATRRRGRVCARGRLIDAHCRKRYDVCLFVVGHGCGGSSGCGERFLESSR